MHTAFKELTPEARRARVVDQLTSVFGATAAEYLDYKECIWSEQENTFEASDTFLYPHQNNGNPIFRNSYFDDQLLISSAESASAFAGYMEGAVHAGNETANKISSKKNP